MRDWLTLYEEQQTAIDDSPQSWWDEEAPIDKTDVEVIAGMLDHLEKRLNLLQEVEPYYWPISEIEDLTEDANKAAKKLADSYDDDQVSFAMDYLEGKYA